MSTSQVFKLTRKAGGGALPRVCVAGVGTAGVRVIDRIGGGGAVGATFAALHTNRSVLEGCQVQTRIPLGDGSVSDGCGGAVALGRKAATRDVELVRGLISDCQALILVAGLGGGTATGALPVLLQAAKGAGVFTAVMLTLPFAFEGSARKRLAEDGLRALLPIADFTAVVSNDSLVGNQQQEAMERALDTALDGLAAGVCSLWQMLAVPSLLSLDQGDLRALGTQGGSACAFAYGMATGPTRANDVMDSLHATFPGVSSHLAGGGGVLACVCASRDLSLDEVSAVLHPVHQVVPDAGVFRAGVVLHESWRDRLFLALFLGDSRRKVTATVRSASGGGAAVAPKGKSVAGARASQEEFNLDGASAAGQGRFGRTKATILDGEDLDIPTYIRRNIKLDQ